MQLKDLPFDEIQQGVEMPGWKKGNKTEWARYFGTMRVGSCVRVSDKKKADAMKAYFRARDVPTRQRAVGDGSFVVWRLRKERSVKPERDEVFPSPTLFDD
jgi:hypothetical protein